MIFPTLQLPAFVSSDLDCPDFGAALPERRFAREGVLDATFCTEAEFFFAQ